MDLNDFINKTTIGDCVEVMKSIPDATVQCVVTSPPYWGLRDYGTAMWYGGDDNCDHLADRSLYETGFVNSKQSTNKGTGNRDIIKHNICPKCNAIRIDNQLGLEKTPKEYVEKMVEIFREIKRILKDDGTVWLNLGDSYANTGCDSSKVGGFTGERIRKKEMGINPNDSCQDSQLRQIPVGLKPKDLVGIPWSVAFALQKDGWYLRSDIIWHKPNPMPESVTDRPTKSHEYIFLLTKSAKYYYDADAIREPYTEPMNRWGGEKLEAKGQSDWDEGTGQVTYRDRDMRPNDLGRNKRSVWTVNTRPYPEAHFATYPPELITPCILAGSKKGDIVLDPFGGSGTTGYVAEKHGRKFILIELNPKYKELADRRNCQPNLF